MTVDYQSGPLYKSVAVQPVCPKRDIPTVVNQNENRKKDLGGWMRDHFVCWRCPNFFCFPARHLFI